VGSSLSKKRPDGAAGLGRSFKERRIFLHSRKRREEVEERINNKKGRRVRPKIRTPQPDFSNQGACSLKRSGKPSLQTGKVEAEHRRSSL